MNGIKIEFTKTNPPIYWCNLLNHLNNKYIGDYQSYSMAMQTELCHFGVVLNPLFAYNNRYETLYFDDKDKYAEFTHKWTSDGH